MFRARLPLRTTRLLQLPKLPKTSANSWPVHCNRPNSYRFLSISAAVSQEAKTRAENLTEKEQQQQHKEKIEKEFSASHSIVDEYYEKVQKKFNQPDEPDAARKNDQSQVEEVPEESKKQKSSSGSGSGPAPYEAFVYEEYPENPEKLSAKNLLGFANDYPISAADQKLVRQAYFNAARRYHPDLTDATDLSEANKKKRADMFILINKAYESLIRTENLYHILGIDENEILKDVDLAVSKDARNQQISMARIFMAYNAKTRALQQDFNNPNRTQQFQELRRAFIILSNASLREEYDRGILKMMDDIYDVAKRHEITDLRAEVRREKIRTKMIKVWKWNWLRLLIIGFLCATPVYWWGMDPDRHYIVTEENYMHYKRNKHLYKGKQFNIFAPWEYFSS